MDREEKLNKIVLLIDEWENYSANHMEEARERALEVNKFNAPGNELEFLAALRKGEEYIQKMNEARRKIAERILEVV
jgi:hypothetical protein